MKSFNEYWKEKGAKRRTSWTSKAKRFARNHSQLEDMRKEAFLPLDYTPGFVLEDYKQLHFVASNPIIVWRQGVFSFSEEGLRKALTAEGADLSTFKMEVSSQSIYGNKAPEPDIIWRGISDRIPNKVLEYEQMYHDWLKKIYQINTDMETVRICYGQISMTIRRYTAEGRPFGYYELVPCEQLTKAAILFQETDFYTFNVATMLMEAAAEWELRNEELNFYAKDLKLRTMQAASTDHIDFELWDEKKLQQKVAEYLSKGYTLDDMIEQVLRPYKLAVKKYIDTVSAIGNGETFESFDHGDSYSKLFGERIIRPSVESLGLKDVIIDQTRIADDCVWHNYSDISMKYNGAECNVRNDGDMITFYPNSHCYMVSFQIVERTSVNAIVSYLKLMPEINQRVDNVAASVRHYFHEYVPGIDE